MTFRRRWDINTRTQLITLGPALLLTLLLISFLPSYGSRTCARSWTTPAN